MKAKLVKQELGYILFDEKGIPIGHTPNVLNNNTFNKLSIKNCQAIERGYDLDELAEEYRNKGDFSSLHYFKAGFQKALELMGDKKFSEEDVISMIEKSRETGLTAQFLILTKQQTEWGVEIEMQKVKGETKIVGAVKGVKGSGSKITTYKSVPKLDADGCLILKRI
jgi:hypothetical protein